MPRISETNNINLNRVTVSSGLIGALPSFVDNANGTLTVGDCTVLLYNNARQEGEVGQYKITGGLIDISDTPNAIRYLVVDYNSGSPQYVAWTYDQLPTWDTSSVTPIYTLYNDNNEIIHAAHWDGLGQGLADKNFRRLLKTERYAHENGVIMTVTDPARTVQSTPGIIWLGSIEHDVPAYNSATPTHLTYFFHHTGTGLTVLTLTGGDGIIDSIGLGSQGTGYKAGDVLEVIGSPAGTGATFSIDTVGASGNVTAITLLTGGTGYTDELSAATYEGWTRQRYDGTGLYPNDGYDDGTGTWPTGTNDWVVSWWYRDVDDSHASYVLGDTAYSSRAEALAAQPRNDLPPEFSVMGVLIGKIICKDGLTVSASAPNNGLVEVAWEQEYAGTSPSNHNDLGGLQGGTGNQYYHMTAAQSTGLVSQDPTVFGADYLHGMGDDVTTLAFDDVTHVFTISGTNWRYYYKGEEVTVATTATIDLDLVGGITFPQQGQAYFIYFNDNSGVLTATETPWNLSEHVPVALVIWNSATGTGIGALFDERHGYRRDIQWHLWAHLTVNTRYLSGMVKTLPVSTNQTTSADLEITGGSIADEDIFHTIPPSTTCRVWYETAAGVWTFQGTSNIPYYDTVPGSFTPEWPLTSAGYALTSLAASKYMPVWCFASPDQDEPIYIVVPSMDSTGDYNSATAARTHPLPTNPEVQEAKLLYRFIYNTNGTLFYDATQDDFRNSGLVASAGVTQNISASQVSFAPYLTIGSTTVQGAIQELVDEAGSALTVADDTTTNASFYPAMNDVTTGDMTTATVSSTKLYFNPSTGTLNSTVFNTLSDAMFKEDIHVINNATDTVKLLDGVGFNWKDNGNKSYGVIAQDLELVIPELVSGDDVKSVNYDGLIAFLINAIKEMDARITELENK